MPDYTYIVDRYINNCIYIEEIKMSTKKVDITEEASTPTPKATEAIPEAEAKPTKANSKRGSKSVAKEEKQAVPLARQQRTLDRYQRFQRGSLDQIQAVFEEAEEVYPTVVGNHLSYVDSKGLVVPSKVVEEDRSKFTPSIFLKKDHELFQKSEDWIDIARKALTRDSNLSISENDDRFQFSYDVDGDGEPIIVTTNDDDQGNFLRKIASVGRFILIHGMSSQDCLSSTTLKKTKRHALQLGTWTAIDNILKVLLESDQHIVEINGVERGTFWQQAKQGKSQIHQRADMLRYAFVHAYSATRSIHDVLAQGIWTQNERNDKAKMLGLDISDVSSESFALANTPDVSSWEEFWKHYGIKRSALNKQQVIEAMYQRALQSTDETLVADFIDEWGGLIKD